MENALSAAGKAISLFALSAIFMTPIVQRERTM
jgi:hypothetical protein